MLGDELLGDGLEQIDLLARGHAHAVVGVGAGHREDALRGVQALHLAQRLGVVHRARAAELPRQLQVIGAGGQEVGVEREDDLHLLEVMVRAAAGAERELGAGEGAVGAERVEAVDLRLGQLALQRREQPLEGGAAVLFDQEGQTLARGGGEGLGLLLGEGVPLLPGRRLAGLARSTRALRVVQAQHLGLGPHVGGAQRGGVVGVALNLGGAALVGLDQQAQRALGAHGGRRVLQPHAGDDLLGLVDEGEDLLFGAAHGHRVAAGQGAQRERSAGELERVAAVEAARQRHAGGELDLEGLGDGGVARLVLQRAPVRGGRGELLAQGRVGVVLHGWGLFSGDSRCTMRSRRC